MEQAIRHADGTLITTSEYAAIKATGRMIKMELLSLPPSRDRRAKDRQKTKTYFRTYYPKEWDAALMKMETQQPLLALCAARWKADHVLGNTLLVKASADSDNDEALDNESDDDDKVQISPESKKRSAGRRPRKKKKKRKTTCSRGADAPNDEEVVLTTGDAGKLSVTRIDMG
jgi:hypothetical protein